jgi:tripartite-type tricarboxylate transporter receptor subunit TctC
MAEFEQACQDKAIRLYVLPPKCPQMNGAVERCNGAWRYEFYSVYDLPRNVDDINPILDSFQNLYNHHRPRPLAASPPPSTFPNSRPGPRSVSKVMIPDRQLTAQQNFYTIPRGAKHQETTMGRWTYRWLVGCLAYMPKYRLCGRHRTLLGVPLIFLLLGHVGWSQSSPNFKIVIPFPAGGAADIVVRILADEIYKAQGASIVVESRPGAGSIIGTEAVAHSPPDGSTLLIVANSFVISPSLRKLTYDPLTSFAAICRLAETPMIMVVGAASPYRTLADFFDDARARPGQLTLASLGPATAQHLAFELLKRLAKVDITFVPYPGTVPSISALLGGHVTASLANYPDVVELVRSGKVRALATTSGARVAILPDVPTISELGFSNYDAQVWIGLVAPANTPQARISQLASWFRQALAIPDVKPRLNAKGIFPNVACGAEFASYLRRQREEYARLIREAGIVPQ